VWLAGLALGVVSACATRDASCNLSCSDHVELTAKTDVSTYAVRGALLRVCLNESLCSEATVPLDACGTEIACIGGIGAFATTVDVEADPQGNSIVIASSADDFAKSDGDRWSIAIVDTSGTTLFEAAREVTYTTEPQACHLELPPCQTLALDL
jgi:hypothetical protein